MEDKLQTVNVLDRVRSNEHVKLNSVSTQLYNFIQSYPTKYHFKLTKNNKQFISHILTDINNAILSWNKLDYQELPYQPHFNNEIFLSIPSKIRNHIIHWRTKTCRSFRFSFDNHNIQIHISMPHSNIENSFFHNSLKMIYLWLFIATKYATKGCSQEMNIYLYLTDLPKKIGKNGEPIRPQHANTAYTHTCKPTTDIVIFRQEEWFKVLIHETFHNLGLDFSGMDIFKIQHKLSQIFFIRSKFELYETYNETWAEILNIIFLAFLSEDKPTNIMSKIENFLNTEIHFSLFQCVKVLQNHNLKYVDILSKNSSNNYDEHTNVFCYYVLKSLVLFFTNDFIEWCSKHNNENILNFNKTSSNLDNFCEFILNIHNRPEYLLELNHMKLWIQQQKMTPIVKNTMRMTIFG